MQRFQFNQEEATSGADTVQKVLEKSDDVIKNYVDMIVNKYPNKIDQLKVILITKNDRATKAINIAIDMVTNDTAGYSDTRDEAITKLKNWASGEQEIKIKKQAQELKKDLETLTKQFGIGGDIVDLNPEPVMGLDLFKEMKFVGEKYLICEEMFRRTKMALDHLQILLKDKNIITSENKIGISK